MQLKVALGMRNSNRRFFVKIKVPLWHLPLICILPGTLTFFIWNLNRFSMRSLESTLIVPIACSLFVTIYFLLAATGKLKMKMSKSQIRKSLPLTLLYLIVVGSCGLLLGFSIAFFVSFILIGLYSYYVQYKYFNTDIFNISIGVNVPAVPPLATFCGLIASVTWVVAFFQQ